MDFHLKQWRDQQHESEEQQPSAPAKLPKLLHHNQQEVSSESALPLFVPEPLNSAKINTNTNTNLSAYPDSISASARFPRVGGGYFSLAQWQELELQALIYRHMEAGAAIPPELLHLVKKSLLNSPSYFLHHSLQHANNYPYYHPASGYWGRGAMDPEPGRCKRTDGKKWRCSRDVVAGQKYCERHMHRGRNRSRKPVEFPTPTTTAPAAAPASSVLGNNGGGGGDLVGRGGGTTHTSSAAFGASAPGGGAHFTLSAGSTASIDMLQLNQGSSELKHGKMGFFDEASGDGKSNNNSRVLRCFFDDWPRSSGNTGSSPATSATCLTMSAPGNPSPDFLKLSTGGNGEEQEARPQLSWTTIGWAGGSNQVAPVGGPLAEALRSSTNSSPTSVLHQMARRSASDHTSFVSA
ncbi:hypothetical protein Ancab_031691 [Ancistrocladus abbreviatus]